MRKIIRFLFQTCFFSLTFNFCILLSSTIRASDMVGSRSQEMICVVIFCFILSCVEAIFTMMIFHEYNFDFRFSRLSNIKNLVNFIVTISEDMMLINSMVEYLLQMAYFLHYIFLNATCIGESFRYAIYLFENFIVALCDATAFTDSINNLKLFTFLLIVRKDQLNLVPWINEKVLIYFFLNIVTTHEIDPQFLNL